MNTSGLGGLIFAAEGMSADDLRGILTILVSATILLLTIVGSVFAAYKFLKKEMAESMTKHYVHEHVLNVGTGETIRDRLVRWGPMGPRTAAGMYRQIDGG